MGRNGSRTRVVRGHPKRVWRDHSRGRHIRLLVATVGALAAMPCRGAAADPTPLAAGLASLVLPGGGQFANGQPGKGVLFLGGTLGTAGLGVGIVAAGAAGGGGAGGNGTVQGLLVASLGIWTWSIGDAVVVAGRHRRQKGEASASAVAPEKPGVTLGFGPIRRGAPGMLLLQARF